VKIEMKTITDLLEKINADESFREKVRSIAKDCRTPDEGVAAMESLGYTITADEWTEYSKPAGNGCTCHELDENELENVSGGWLNPPSYRFKSEQGWASLSEHNTPDRVRCETSCYGLVDSCLCHGQKCCVGKMHEVTYNTIQIGGGRDTAGNLWYVTTAYIHSNRWKKI